MEQNYLIIESNVVTNTILWDGNTSTWTPPKNSTLVLQEDTPAYIWRLSVDKTSYELTEEIGAGGIGFTWDGTHLTTNADKPTA